jgi:prepilin-type N-terminal cleavage/methylation domain-containing protein
MVAGGLQASGYWPTSGDRPPGYSLVELLFAVAIMATVSAIAVPQSLATVDRARALSAARFLASRMAVARSQAIMRSTHVALQFEDRPSGITFRMFVDGNRNGVRTNDISAGIDVPVEAPVRLRELYQGVAIAVSGAAGSDPVRLGTSNLLSFTPLGTSTSGSVFVRGRDGSQFAVRVLGATGRARLLQYVPRSGEWVDGL